MLLLLPSVEGFQSAVCYSGCCFPCFCSAPLFCSPLSIYYICVSGLCQIKCNSSQKQLYPINLLRQFYASPEVYIKVSPIYKNASLKTVYTRLIHNRPFFNYFCSYCPSGSKLMTSRPAVCHISICHFKGQ